MKSISVRIFIIMLFTSTLVNAERKYLYFSRIVEKDGLSHEWVRTIIKDSEGFVWFGTRDGLNRYDGSQINVYREQDLNSTNVLTDYSFYTLYENNDTTLWIGTSSGGLNKYNKKTGQFSNYSTHKFWETTNTKNIRSITTDKDGNLWLAITGSGLCRFNPSNDEFKLFKNDPENSNSLSNNEVYSVVNDGENIWVGTSGGGVDLLNIKSESFTHYSNSERKGSLSNNSVFVIYKDSKSRIWVGTDNGLNLFDTNTKTFKHFFYNKNDPSSICDNRIASLAEDKAGILWIATKNALSSIDIKGDLTDGFVNYFYDSSIPTSLSSNELNCVYIDDNEILWVGTSNGGVCHTSLKAQPFNHYKHKTNDLNSLSHNIVRCIYEDIDKNLWIGTDGGGLNLKKDGSDIFEHIVLDQRNELNKNRPILTFMQDKHGDMWIGTYGDGIFRIKRGAIYSTNRNFTHYTSDPKTPNSLVGNIIKAIYEDREGRIWIGADEGLCLYNPLQDDFTTQVGDTLLNSNLCDSRVQSNSILEDSDGFLWIGTWKGLNKRIENRSLDTLVIDGVSIPPKSVYYKHYLHRFGDATSLSENRITCILESKDKTVWVGTYGKGINKYNKQTDSFKSFKQTEGLIDNNIYTALEDDDKNLWLASNRGLTKFSTQDYKVYNYNESDGLSSSYFFWGACAKKKNGDLLFGGINGFTQFNPKLININKQIPRICITDILLNNRYLKSINEYSSINVPIWELDSLTLTYGNNQLMFKFSALNYLHPYKNKYAYMLVNFDSDWIYAGDKNDANYTGLKPGSYIFKVIGSNNDGIWNYEGTSITIVILPPFYETWWFRSISILLIISLIWLIIRWRVVKIKRQRNLLKEMVDERTVELNKKNKDLLALNSQLFEVNSLLEETNEELSEQKEQLIFHQDEITRKSEELELHRNHLEELVDKRTEELVIAKDKAEESERLKASFLANMSHEIRTPLNAIVGFSNLLTLDTNTPEEIESFTLQINKNTEALLILIDDILDLSIIEAKRAICTESEFPISTLVDNIYDYWKTHAKLEDREILYENQVNDPHIMVKTDEHKLRQIINNLMSNACKFTEKGSVTLGFQQTNGNFIFYVKDTGIGIARKNKEIIFDWFRKVEDDKNKLYRGTGLGLAISSRLAEILGGRLWVDSELNVGSTFYFSIPESVLLK